MDIIGSANKNFEEAYNLAVNRLGTLTEIITHQLGRIENYEFQKN